jgi:hypothetical protein
LLLLFGFALGISARIFEVASTLSARAWALRVGGSLFGMPNNLPRRLLFAVGALSSQ